MLKKRIGIIRGKYLNNYEMQNYVSVGRRFSLVGFSSLKPIHLDVGFLVKRLFSLMDLPNFPKKMALLNRLCFGDAMYLFGLENALKSFDVAHVRESYFHITQQALSAKRKGYVKKVVCTCSETIPFNHEDIWRRKLFKKRAFKEVDKFHCLTEKAKECLVKEGCDSRKIVVFPYGVDLSKFKVGIKNKKTLNILFVGRLVKEKGIYDLLKVFIKLKKSKYDVRLAIVGKGPEEDSLKNLINQIKMKDYIKVKNIPYDKIPLEYQKADIFVLLSKPTKYWEEYLGMSIIEAMASGLAVVSTKSGGIPEVVSKCGLLVKPGEWKKAFKAVEKLIKNKKLRKSLGSKARKRAEKYFDSKKVVKKIEKLWL